jgi:26S proteasome regulatory subunit N10
LVEQPSVLQTLAKKAKKNGLAIDIVNIGSNENVEKLQNFIETVNNADNSHFLHIENRSLRVPDVVISSPIAQSGASAPGEIGHPVNSAVDPSQDPELAEAIRQSLEEQKNTLAKSSTEEKKEQKTEEKKEEKKAEAPAQEVAEGLTEEEELQRAIELSIRGEGQEVKKEESPKVAEERKEPAAPVKEQKKTEDLEAQLMQNPEFVKDLIQSLPGMTEEGRKKVLSSVVKKEETKKEEKKEEETKKQ